MFTSTDKNSQALPDFQSSLWKEISGNSQSRTYLFRAPNGSTGTVCKLLAAIEDGEYLAGQFPRIAQLAANPVPGVSVFDQLVQEGTSYRLMRQYSPGWNVLQHAESHGQLEDILKIGMQVTRILESLHSRNVFHANLKPTNIIVSPQGDITLVDGLLDFARLCCSLTDLQDRDQIAYYSPEQLGVINERPEATSDLYSLGIVLFECLTGSHPFAQCDVSDILVNKMLPTASRFRDKHGNPVPRVVCELISRLTCSAPGNRYQTAAAVRQDLEKIVSGLGVAKNPSVALGTSDVRSSVVKPNLIGRESEFSRLSDELQNCCEGNAGLATIEAVSGCGKSTLLEELGGYASQCGFWVLGGIGQSEVAPVLFSCWRS